MDKLSSGRPAWWRRAVVYQVFPLTFMDSSGDGIGDLRGIRERLDYIASLGVGAIWLSPIHPTPLVDFGYDVADYFDVDRRFGTLADVDALVRDAHARGLRVILDFVPNHTSDQHPWFVESRSSRDNDRRDWYLWRDPRPDGSPPNNWLSYFGPAWTYDDRTGQSYFHQFRAQQPELNYANPAVLRAMQDVLRFWLERGIDGFRVDVVALLAKDPEFRDAALNPAWREGDPLWFRLLHTGFEDQPAVHEIIRSFRRVTDEYDDRVLIGELDPLPSLMSYYGETLDELQLPFNFWLVNGLAWQAPAVRAAVDAYDAAVPPGAWPNWVLGNHDRQRIAVRVGESQARVAQMLVMTLRGTPFVYYGDELGMRHADMSPARLRDGVGQPDLATAMHFSRDRWRTPMQWDGGPTGGFCPPTVEPFLPLAEGHERLNVAAAESDDRSMVALFRELTRLRGEHDVLTDGDYRSLDGGDPDVFAYERSHDGRRLLVALNFTGRARTANLTGVPRRARVLLSTWLDRAGDASLERLELREDEGVVVAVD